MTRKFLLPLTIVSLSATSALTSCDDALDNPYTDSTSDIISFTIDAGANEWNTLGGVGSRQPAETDSVVEQLIPLEGGGDSLFLRMTIAPMPAPTQETKAESRSYLRDDYFYIYSQVSAFEYPAGTWNGTQKPNLFHLETLTFDSSTNSYTMDNNYHWPGKAFNLRFFCMSPSDCGWVTSASNKGYPRILFSVNTTVDKQVSLLAGMSEEYAGNHGKAVDLKLKHTTATVRFQESKDLVPGTITEIKLKDLYSTGEYSLETESWSGQYGLVTYSQTVDKEVNGTAGSDITDDYKKVFTVLPQQTVETATIEITYRNKYDNSVRVLSAPLNARFEAGKQYIYSLANNDVRIVPFISIDGKAGSQVGSGQDSVFIDLPVAVKTVSKSLKLQLKMERDGKTDTIIGSGTGFSYSLYEKNPATGIHDKEVSLADCSMLSTFTPGATTISLKTLAPTYYEADPILTKKLKDAPAKGSSTEPYNLANATGAATVENTANCYIVDAPGTYSLPLVYGNAIKNRMTNSQALLPSIFGTNSKYVMSYPVGGFASGDSYISYRISTPFICDQEVDELGKIRLDGAKIIWQDSEDLVSNLRISDDQRSLTFDVDESTIREGNAVIAVYSGNDNIWTWHIWVTNFRPGESYKEFKGMTQTRKMMTSLLGWVDKRRSSDEKVYRLVCSLEGSDKQVEFYLRQQPAHYLYGHAPFWQWGRPTPFQPYINLYTGGTAPTYSSFDLSSSADKLIKLATCIAMSDMLQKGLRTFTNLANTWNWTYDGAQYDINICKSMYDPCPVGYMVSPMDAFNSMFTGSGTFESGFFFSAVEFYCNPNKRDDDGTVIKTPDNTMVLPLYTYGVLSASTGNVTFNNKNLLYVWTGIYRAAQSASAPTGYNFKSYNTYSAPEFYNLLPILPMRED